MNQDEVKNLSIGLIFVLLVMFGFVRWNSQMTLRNQCEQQVFRDYPSVNMDNLNSYGQALQTCSKNYSFF